MLQPMTTLKRILILTVILLAVVQLMACGQVNPVPIPASTATLSLTLSTPSPQISDPLQAITPSPSTPPILEFAITENPEQVAHWEEYEQALASKLLSYLPPEEVLCEWEILGQGEKVVYVWAVCMGLPPTGRSDNLAPGASIPAVIHLGLDSFIQRIELPRDNYTSYVEGIQKIFPESVKEKISERSMKIVEMVAHIRLRREEPEAPLIILWSTP